MESTFAAALQRRRLAQDLSLRELSALVRYSAGWLSRVARGKGSPTLLLARACDEALGAGGELLTLARAELADGERPEQLPAAMSAFAGRAEVPAELDAALAGARTDGVALSVAVDGSPGVGKTAVALRWARRVADHFPDGVLFTDLRGHSPEGGPADPRPVLSAFLTALGRKNPPDALEDRAALFRTTVAQRPGSADAVSADAVGRARIAVGPGGGARRGGECALSGRGTARDRRSPVGRWRGGAAPAVASVAAPQATAAAGAAAGAGVTAAAGVAIEAEAG